MDDGFEQNMNIPIFYDPLIAKMISHSGTREEAIDRMIRAIDEYQITGLATTLSFCKFVMQHQAFRTGEFDTKFIEKYFSPNLLEAVFSDEEKMILAAIGVFMYDKSKNNTSPTSASIQETPASSKWKNRLK